MDFVIIERIRSEGWRMCSKEWQHAIDSVVDASGEWYERSTDQSSTDSCPGLWPKPWLLERPLSAKDGVLVADVVLESPLNLFHLISSHPGSYRRLPQARISLQSIRLSVNPSHTTRPASDRRLDVHDKIDNPPLPSSSCVCVQLQLQHQPVTVINVNM